MVRQIALDSLWHASAETRRPGIWPVPSGAGPGTRLASRLRRERLFVSTTPKATPSLVAENIAMRAPQI